MADSSKGLPLCRLQLTALLASALLASATPVAAATNLLAFTRGASTRQGAFEAAGIAWTCGGELCSAQAPDDAALWPGLCAAFAREAGPVAAFGSVSNRFDPAELARCNEAGALPRAAERTAPAPQPSAQPTVAAPPSAPGPPAQAPAAPPVPAAAAAPHAGASAREIGGPEICNGRDDDGDGEIDEGVRLRVWEDLDHDLYGDPKRSREICPQELRPGLVVNDYDCDDSDAKRSPARDSCG